MTSDTVPDDSIDGDPVTAKYVAFDKVAEKTWQVTLNDGFANIVIDFLAVTDPGPAKQPEIRIYTEEPREEVSADSIREVLQYPDGLSPSDGEPDAVWRPDSDEQVAVIRIPHAGAQLPVLEIDFNTVMDGYPSTHVTAYTLEEQYTTETTNNDKPSIYTVAGVKHNVYVRTADQESD